MAKGRRPAEDLSIEELEAILARKKLEARRERVSQFHRSGRALKLSRETVPISRVEDFRSLVEDENAEGQAGQGLRARLREAFNRGLLAIEVVAVVGLGFVFVSGFGALQELNQEVARAIGELTPTATPLITALVLPSGHTPPNSPGGAQPNEAEIPPSLRPLVQSLPALAIPTPGPEQARSIHIPALWEYPAPVVQGDGWEQLKRGVGQHLGTANPGENGNMVLSAHNDIFGELFRDLSQLKPGDEILVLTATRELLYKVTGLRIVEPTDVGVMEPTVKPTITLISCYPYLVDNQRIVVFGELVSG